MFIKKHLSMLTLILLLSNALIQGMMDSLHNAIENNDYDALIDLLENKKILPDSLNKDNKAIIEAAMKNDSRFLKKLIEYGANVNVCATRLGRRPIHFACYDNKTIKNIKLLVKAGADIEAKIDGHSTPFFEALYQYIRREDCKEVMRVLIERGANIAFKFNGSPTVLAWAERSLSEQADQKGIARDTWLRDLLIKAPQIRAEYLKKKADKTAAKELKLAQKTLGKDMQVLVKNNMNIKSDTTLIISDTEFNMHVSILSARCPALLNV